MTQYLLQYLIVEDYAPYRGLWREALGHVWKF
jgi:hypothetical protein